MSNKFYRKPARRQRTLGQRVLRNLALLAKCVIMTLYPIPLTLLVGWVWHHYVWGRGVHFSHEAEVILTAAWIPIFGIMYSLMAAIVLATVWREYKQMRIAVKQYDLDTFIDLRDESTSPLVHTLMTVLSFFVLVGFAGLQYPEEASGLVCVMSTTYLLTLLLMVVIEIDNPCSGLWFIKDIPPEWLEIDADAYRSARAKSSGRSKLEERPRPIAVDE